MKFHAKGSRTDTSKEEYDGGLSYFLHAKAPQQDVLN
jgi:hypothetical protein